MSYLRNLLYLLAFLLLSPWLVYKALTTRKYRRGFLRKWLGDVRHPALVSPEKRTGPCVWFHGVSLGEIHVLKQLVPFCRRQHPEWHVVVSTTTDAGFDEANKLFPDLPVVFWPFDFTWSVKRALSLIRPDLLVLTESEIWPNVLRIAGGRGVKLALVNGRMSPRSARRYGKIRWMVQGLFRAFDACGVQTAEYAEHWRSLGACNVVVTGNIKYDGANLDRGNDKTQAMRRWLGLAADALVFVAGSTQAPEERFCLDICRKAKAAHPNLRFVVVPRQKERFEEVAALLQAAGQPFERRSRRAEPMTDDRILLVDTFGELSALWGLADVAFVGGSLDGKRGGQNMIEPAAYGAAVVFGPHTWNFKETVARLLEANGAIRVEDAEQLESAVLRLLADATERHRLGEAAQAFVRTQQGATRKTLEMLEAVLAR